MKKLLEEKKEILGQLEEIGKDSTYIHTLSEVALIQFELGQFEESEKNFRICLKHFKKQNDRFGIASVYGIFGAFFFKKGEYDKSIDYYQNSLEIYKELLQVPEQITCLKGIGLCLLKQEKLYESSETFLECSEICASSSDIYNLLDCLSNLITIHEKLGNWDVVFELYKKVLESFKQLDDMRGVITAYLNLGILEKRKGNYESALTFFKRGTNQAIDSNYAELIIKGLGYVGEILFQIGKKNEATGQFIRALSIAKSVHAENAIKQLNILLKSIGLTEDQIQNKLKEYNKSRKKTK